MPASLRYNLRMPKIGIPGVLAVLCTHMHTAEAKDWRNITSKYKRYLVIANPKRREMGGRSRRTRPKKWEWSICRNQVTHCIWSKDTAVNVKYHNTIKESSNNEFRLNPKWGRNVWSLYMPQKKVIVTPVRLLFCSLDYTLVILRALNSKDTTSKQTDGLSQLSWSNACMA